MSAAPAATTTSPFRRPPPIKTLNIPSSSSVGQTSTPQTQQSNLALLYPPQNENDKNQPIHLWNVEEIAGKARTLLNLVIKNSVPTGNLYCKKKETGVVH
jgi:hypothetical protein